MFAIFSGTALQAVLSSLVLGPIWRRVAYGTRATHATRPDKISASGNVALLRIEARHGT